MQHAAASLFDPEFARTQTLAQASAQAPVASMNDSLALLDAPQEWIRFSQACKAVPEQPDQLWESRVVVKGMHCSSCALTLENLLLGVPGVASARVSAAGARASVVWNPALTRPSKWMGRPLARGYELLPASDPSALHSERRAARLALWRWLIAGFCMMQVMMYAFPAYIAAPGDITPDIEKLLRWASWVLSLPVVLFSCAPFFGNALRDLRHRSISMDLPVALGIAVTFAVSSAATFEPQGWWGHEVYFDSLTMFVFFLLTGRWLEQRLRARTAGALDSLMQRLPATADRLGTDGQYQRVAVRVLAAGDLIRVLPGEAFPGDGTIVAGNTFADEALLTGESRPVPRPVGSAVLAGSHNLSATVQVRVDEIGPSTRYSQIVALMGRAAIDKPRLALLADRIARPFLWFVLVAAAMALAFWWPSDPARALMAAVAVLIVTCPCALSLATPAAMLSSAGLLARSGVLVRRLQALESLAGIDTIVFDKTGTLTEARMGVMGIVCREGLCPEQALQLAVALAQHSLHPVSRALLAAANERGGEGVTASDMAAAVAIADAQEHAGQGVEGRLPGPAGQVSRGIVRLGSARFCSLGVDDAVQSGDRKQVFLADADGWLASFDIDEVIRADAQQAVSALTAAGVDVQMLSGDGHAAARRIAGRLGIRTVQGDSTPQQKLERIRVLQQQGRKIWMVGDGLNDGPVLAGAQVSVAIGNAVPLAQAQSDFVLPGGQLRLLPVMLAQARRTMRVVRQNLAWAALYNIVCVPLALAGWLPAWLAGLGMALSSLVVVANAARLARTPVMN
jgi:P-type Cu2+ transporter